MDEQKDKKLTSNNHVPPLSQLCWNCKRAYAGDDQCTWTKNFKPVKGWTADKRVVKESGKKDINTYWIKECPLFIKDSEFGCDYSEITEWLSKEFNVSWWTAYRNYFKLLMEYEKKTGIELPLWLWENGNEKGAVKRKETYEKTYRSYNRKHASDSCKEEK